MSDILSENKVFFKYINSGITDDFYVMVVGYEKMDSDAPAKGPYFKTNFTLHYCLRGKGMFSLGGKTYEVGAGDVFLIPPNVVVKYRQDAKDPWAYVWYEFCGKATYELLERAQLNEKHPVYHTQTEGLAQLLLAPFDTLESAAEDLECTGYLYLFLSKLIAERSDKRESGNVKRKVILDDIIKYIDNNFCNSLLTLETVSKSFHLNKSYLARLFRAGTNVTVSHYILMLRINKACELLGNSNLPIKTIAYSIGFNDALYFSKKFKEAMGFSPTEFYATHKQKSDGE